MNGLGAVVAGLFVGMPLAVALAVSIVVSLVLGARPGARPARRRYGIAAMVVSLLAPPAYVLAALAIDPSLHVGFAVAFSLPLLVVALGAAALAFRVARKNRGAPR